MIEMRTRRFQIVRLVSLTTLMVSILAIVAKSQTSTASLKGVVDDGSGRVVPGTTLGATNFGVITGTEDPRQLQLAVRLYF